MFTLKRGALLTGQSTKQKCVLSFVESPVNSAAYLHLNTEMRFYQMKWFTVVFQAVIVLLCQNSLPYSQDCLCLHWS